MSNTLSQIEGRAVAYSRHWNDSMGFYEDSAVITDPRQLASLPATLPAVARRPIVPTLRNGLTVAFPSLLWGRNCYTLIPTLHGFTVTLGHTLTLGAHELFELAPAVYAEVEAMADRFMREEADDEDREHDATRDWRAHA